MNSIVAKATKGSSQNSNFEDILPQNSEKSSGNQYSFSSEQISDDTSTMGADTSLSLSSISNTFFNDPGMSVVDFRKADYKKTQGYKDYVEKCVNNYRQTRTDFDEAVARKSIEDQIDGIIRVSLAAKQAGYDIFDAADRKDSKDSKGRSLFSSLEPNSEYFTSNDISTTCDKRRNFAEIYDEIVSREEQMGVPHNKKPLTL